MHAAEVAWVGGSTSLNASTILQIKHTLLHSSAMFTVIQCSYLRQKFGVALLNLIVKHEISVSHSESSEPVSIRRCQQWKQLVLLSLIIQYLWFTFTAAQYTVYQTPHKTFVVCTPQILYNFQSATALSLATIYLAYT